VRTLLKSRQTFFEIDMRFGQLGPRGIFASLDSAGVLNHHVDGVDNIELAMTEPPARGRARVRGQAIRRLAGHKNARCDWQYIVDSGEDRVLDLTDPFIEEEQWRPLSEFDVFDRRVPHRFLNDFAFELGSDDGRGPSLYARRVEAFECYQRGDYSGAEERLRLLVDEGYELASNRCHIARALMLMGRDAEARQQVDLALGALPGACDYVFPRILFFKLLFTILDGADGDAAIGEVKSALRTRGACSEWTIQPMLDHLRPRLGEESFRFITALAAALCDASAIARMEGYPQWSSAGLVTS